MTPRPSVLIVGGGAIGCALARELAGRGAAVTVLERAKPGSEASGAAAGLIAPQAEGLSRGPLFDLAAESRRLYPPSGARSSNARPGLRSGGVRRGCFAATSTGTRTSPPGSPGASPHFPSRRSIGLGSSRSRDGSRRRRPAAASFSARTPPSIPAASRGLSGSRRRNAGSGSFSARTPAAFSFERTAVAASRPTGVPFRPTRWSMRRGRGQPSTPTRRPCRSSRCAGRSSDSPRRPPSCPASFSRRRSTSFRGRMVPCCSAPRKRTSDSGKRSRPGLWRRSSTRPAASFRLCVGRSSRTRGRASGRPAAMRCRSSESRAFLASFSRRGTFAMAFFSLPSRRDGSPTRSSRVREKRSPLFRRPGFAKRANMSGQPPKGQVFG